jgi:hypothetical protein
MEELGEVEEELLFIPSNGVTPQLSFNTGEKGPVTVPIRQEAW